MDYSMPYRLPSGLFVNYITPVHWELLRRMEGQFIRIGRYNSLSGLCSGLDPVDRELADQKYGNITTYPSRQGEISENSL